VIRSKDVDDGALPDLYQWVHESLHASSGRIWYHIIFLLTRFSEVQNENTAQQPSANMTNSSSVINVSIVQGASALNDKAYQPNPVIVKVGNAIM
jgi:hypothetical protein